MPSFCVYANMQKDWAVEMVMDISQLLMKNGYSYTKDRPDFTIVIGGDGTLYHYLSELKGKVLLIGSETTYRSQLNNKNWKSRIIRLLRRGKSVRLPLLDVRSEGVIIGRAMNDVVFHTNDHNIVKIKYIIDKKVVEFCGDGLIIATPFGSSAYSYSAGGKKLPLSSSSLSITPICPYLKRVKPKVSNTNEIDVVAPSNASLLLDGKLARVSCQGSIFTITKSSRHVEFLQ
ncbi:MAG: hypothetical protein QXS93_01080 [Candidatus Micrarchaeia archaeon]